MTTNLTPWLLLDRLHRHILAAMFLQLPFDSQLLGGRFHNQLLSLLGQSMVHLQTQSIVVAFPVFDQRFVRMNLAMRVERIRVIRLLRMRFRQQSGCLSARHMEVGLAHARIASDTHSGPGESDVLAQRTALRAPFAVLHFEQSDGRQMVHLAKGHSGHVQSAHQVHPLADVRLLENAALIRTQLAAGFGHVRFAGLAEPGLCGAGRNSARNAGAVADAVATFVNGNTTAVAFDNLVGIVRPVAQASATDGSGQKFGVGPIQRLLRFGLFEQLLGRELDRLMVVAAVRFHSIRSLRRRFVTLLGFA